MDVIHPKPTELALFATGDLSLARRMSLRRHLRRCASCSEELANVRRVVLEVQSGQTTDLFAPMPALDWKTLEREMVGNIGVGLAASRCIDRGRIGAGLAWRGVFLASVMSVLFCLGWMTHIPEEQSQHLVGSLERLMLGNPVRPNSDVRSELRQLSLGVGNDSLKLLHPPAAETECFGSTEINVRYVDDDTGELTMLTISREQPNAPEH